MVRQEAIDKAVGQARRRKANAIIDFKFKTELSQNINDDNVVLITATGKCCIVRRMLSDREQLMRRQMEDSRKVGLPTQSLSPLVLLTFLHVLALPSGKGRLYFARCPRQD